jgi:hypothetical protein
MESNTNLSASMRDLLSQDHETFQLRKAILEHDLLDMTVGDALLQQNDFLKEFSRLPSVEPKTVEVVSHLLDRQISQLFSDASEFRRSPTARTPLADALKSWSDDAGQEHISFPSVSGSYVAGAMDEKDKHPLWALVHANGKKVFLLPVTIPDLFKTEDVWRAERQGQPVNEGYASNLQIVLEVAARTSAVVTFVIDETVWKELKTRTGRYASLTEKQAAKQIDILKAVSLTFRDQAIFETANFKLEGLSNCLAVEGEFVSSYWFGGYYRTNDPRFVHHVYRRIERADRWALEF